MPKDLFDKTKTTKNTGLSKQGIMTQLMKWLTTAGKPVTTEEMPTEYTPSGLPVSPSPPSPFRARTDFAPISTMGFPTQQLGTTAPKPEVIPMEALEALKLRSAATQKKWTGRKQEWIKKQEEHKEYMIEYNKGKVAWEKWEKERMDKIMELYKYAVEHNIPSYEPTSGQVALGMPFGVPKNIAPLLMQEITQQENQRQMEEHWQKQMGGLEPEVRATLSPETLGIPAEYHEALIQSDVVKEEKSKDKAKAIGLLGQYISSLIQRAPEEGINPSERVMQIIQTLTPEQLEQEFGYPLTYQDIIEAFSSIMKITMGEYGG